MERDSPRGQARVAVAHEAVARCPEPEPSDVEGVEEHVLGQGHIPQQSSLIHPQRQLLCSLDRRSFAHDLAVRQDGNVGAGGVPEEDLSVEVLTCREPSAVRRPEVQAQHSYLHARARRQDGGSDPEEPRQWQHTDDSDEGHGAVRGEAPEVRSSIVEGGDHESCAAMGILGACEVESPAAVDIRGGGEEVGRQVLNVNVVENALPSLVRGTRKSIEDEVPDDLRAAVFNALILRGDVERRRVVDRDDDDLSREEIFVGADVQPLRRVKQPDRQVGNAVVEGVQYETQGAVRVGDVGSLHKQVLV
mmetsp:Transcript_28448/g.64512  ORF Transcript_28448/g.64512 Transcript_28448/m.64512 type:complete len:305 (+) Transcript_28448:2170-3084(+)